MMSRSWRLRCVLASGALLGFVGLQAQGRVLLRIQNASRLFGATPAPVGTAVLAYAQTEESSGEFAEGTAVILQFGAEPAAKLLEVPPSLEDPNSTAWSPDGNKVYFITDRGIYSLALNSGKIVREFDGVFAGLALASDRSRLATWNLKGPNGGHHLYTLTVFSLGNKGELRHWAVPVKYSGDQYGHEIAFFNGDREILARTYDTERTTPLKRFELSTGAVETVSPDVWSFVTAQNDAYLIEEFKGVFSLQLLRRGASTPQLVAPDIPFNTFTSSVNPDVLAVENLRTGAVARYHIRLGTFERIQSACTGVVPLSDGRVIYIQRNVVFDSPAGCGTQDSQ